MRTEANVAALEEALQANCGDFFGACKTCKLSPSFVKRWMSDDAAVAERLDNAKQVGAMQLEHYAVKYATEGVPRGIYYKGDRVDTDYEPSIPMLQTLLKKRIPEVYADDVTSGQLINYGNINIMPRADSYDQWLNMKQLTEQKLIEGENRLDGIEDAEFVPVVLAPEDDPDMADLL